MARDVRVIPEMKIKYKDVFHLKNLYVMMHEYLLEEGFVNVGGAGPIYTESHDAIEKLYYEKVFQKGIHSGGKEMWILWRMQKMPETKTSLYFRYLLDIDFHGVYIKPFETTHQGKKITLSDGEVEISFRGKIQSDYNDVWKNHWLLKHFHEIYDKRLMDHELEKREKELWRDLIKLTGRVKRFLNMRTFVPEPEPFWQPKYGYEE